MVQRNQIGQQQENMNRLEIEEMERESKYKQSPGYQQQLEAEQRKAQYEAEKADFELDKAIGDADDEKLKKMGEKTGDWVDLLGNVLHADPAEQAGVYKQTLREAKRLELIDDEALQMFDKPWDQQIQGKVKEMYDSMGRSDERIKKAEVLRLEKKEDKKTADELALARQQTQAVIESVMASDDPITQGTTYKSLSAKMRGEILPGLIERGFEVPPGGIDPLMRQDIVDGATGIIAGMMPPPNLGGRQTQFSQMMMAELSRRGFDLSKNLLEFGAIKKYLMTKNSVGYVRLNDAISFTYKSIKDQLKPAFEEWQKHVRGRSGFRQINKAALAASLQLPGEAGAAAQKLSALIADTVSELAVVYKGGTSPTDETLKLAHENFGKDWNQEQFFATMDMILDTLEIRNRVLKSVNPLGVDKDSLYFPDQPGIPSLGNEGDTPNVKALRDEYGYE
jgi:hypothetical protein